MTDLLTPEVLASFVALTFLEIVLGIDNIVFLAVAVGRLPAGDQRKGRTLGLWMAMALRILMLIGLVWITKLDIALFNIMDHDVTIKDLVLIGGGGFLLAKGTMEMHHEIEGEHDDNKAVGGAKALAAAVVQIALINIVFSLDSVITAIGMTDQIVVMVAAVIASTLVMLFAAKPVGDFIEARPTAKMLALSFILLVGVALIADGFGFHMPRGYLYFAIAFSLGVEILNGLYHKRRKVKRAKRIAGAATAPAGGGRNKKAS